MTAYISLRFHQLPVSPLATCFGAAVEVAAVGSLERTTLAVVHRFGEGAPNIPQFRRGSFKSAVSSDVCQILSIS